MRIYPRIVEFDTTAADSDGNCFFIKNSSADHRILLFKIRRSDPKLVDFTPKRGIIEPGVTQCIHLSLSDAKVSYARLLVKLVVVSRDDLVPENFDKSWEVGATSKMIKKVIDIHNKAFVVNDDHSSEPTASIEGSDDFRNSPMQEDEVDGQRTPGDIKDGLALTPTQYVARSRTPNSVDTNTIDAASPSETVDTVDGLPEDSAEKSPSQATPVAVMRTPASVERTDSRAFESFNSSFQYNIANDSSTAQIDMSRAAPFNNLSHIILQNVLKTISSSSKPPFLTNASAISENDALLVGLGLGMGLQLNSNTPSLLTGQASDATANDASGEQKSGDSAEGDYSPSKEEKSDGDSRKCLPRHITDYSDAISDSSGGCIVQVNGNDVVENELAAELIRERSDFAVNVSKKNLNSIQISHTKITSIAAALNPLLDIGSDKIKALVCQDTLRHLQLSHSKLVCIDLSINKFTKLSSLDLSNNDISSLEGNLVLPYLHHLKLSNNKLKTLDFLQHQVMLESLDVSGNKLCSFRYSVHMLVPLASSLKSLNLSRNPICAHKKYVSDVMSIMPKLQLFDAVDLAYAHKSYKKINALAIKSNLSAPPLPIELSKDIFPPNAPLSDDRATSEANAANEDMIFRWRVKNALRSKKFEEKRLGATAREGRNKDHSFVHPDNDASTYSASYSMASSAKKVFVGSSSIKQATSSFPERRVEVEGSEEESEEQHPSTTQRSRRGRENHTDDEEAVATEQTSAVQPPPKSHFEPARARKSSSPARRTSMLLMPRKLDTSRRRAFGIATSMDSSGYSFQTAQTASSQLKKKSPAMAEKPAKTQRDYSSDSEAMSNPYRKRGDVDDSSRRSPRELSQMNMDERRGMWHPRYRVPQQTFGYSKPFVHRLEPSPAQAPKPPLFDKFVRRLRDGFEKLPARGTFGRDSRALPADFYPMDWDDVEAFRRQGYFKETIGSIQEMSFKDRSGSGLSATLNKSTGASFRTNTSAKAPLNVSISKTTKSSVYLQSSPTGSKDVRDYLSAHVSRMHTNVVDSKFSRPPDEFSDYRKWHPELFDKNGFLIQDVEKQSSKLNKASPPRPSGSFFDAGSSPRRSSSNQQEAVFTLFKHEVDDTEDADEGSEYMQWLEQQGKEKN